MSAKRSRFRFELYVRDWLTGTRHLSLEARGLYIDLLALINERRERRIPNDPSEIIPKLGLRDRRTWQRVLGELVARGKIEVADGWISNRRVRLDVEKEEEKPATPGPGDGQQSPDSRSTDGQLMPDNRPIAPCENEQNQSLVSDPCPGTKNLEPSQVVSKEEKETPDGVSKKKAVPRATRLDPAWQLTPDLLAFALSSGMSERQARFEADRFRDYWIAKSGQGATKTDWAATWRNWVRTAISQSRGKSNGDGVVPFNERGRNRMASPAGG